MDILKVLLTPFNFVKSAVVDITDEIKKEIERKKIPCVFPPELSERDFEALAVEVAKPIKRLTVAVDHQFVHGTVKAQSGISTWKFTVDFNDFGTVTGKHWLKSENSDSLIPKNYSNELELKIKDFITKAKTNNG